MFGKKKIKWLELLLQQRDNVSIMEELSGWFVDGF